jgi:hypothetical protein
MIRAMDLDPEMDEDDFRTWWNAMRWCNTSECNVFYHKVGAAITAGTRARMNETEAHAEDELRFLNTAFLKSNVADARLMIEHESQFIFQYRALAKIYGIHTKVGRRQILVECMTTKMKDKQLPAVHAQSIAKKVYQVYKPGSLIPVDQLIVDMTIGTMPDSATWSNRKVELLRKHDMTIAEFVKETAEDAKYISQVGLKQDVSAFAVQLEELQNEMEEMRNSKDEGDEEEIHAAFEHQKKELTKWKAKALAKSKAKKTGGGKPRMTVQQVYDKHLEGANEKQKKALAEAKRNNNCFACAKCEDIQIKHKRGSKCPNQKEDF